MTDSHIESTCEICRARLRVAAQHAGKQARCPQCDHVYLVVGNASHFRSGVVTPGAVSPRPANPSPAQTGTFSGSPGGDSTAANEMDSPRQPESLAAGFKRLGFNRQV